MYRPFSTANKHDQTRILPCYIIIKMLGLENKEKILKVEREKWLLTCKDKYTRITLDFSNQTLKVMKVWNNIFQALKKNNCQPRWLHSAKLSFNFDGEIKTL
jgi:hypothetical protein